MYFRRYALLFSLTSDVIDNLASRQGIEVLLEDPEFSELEKFTLQAADWDALEAFKEILEVSD